MLISAFTNTDHWYLNEIRTIMLGRCTITCHLPAIKALDYLALESGYELNSTFNYQVSHLVVTLEKKLAGFLVLYVSDTYHYSEFSF